MPSFFKYLPGNEVLREEAGDGTGGKGDGGYAASANAQDTNKQGETTKDKPSDSAAPKDKPDDEKAQLIKDVMKWKEKARESQTELQAAKAVADQLAKLKEAVGETSVDELKALVEQRKEAERLKAEEKGEYERIVAQMKEENKKRVQEIEDKAKAALEELKSKESVIQSLTIGRAFSDSAFVRESSTLPPSIAQKEFGDFFEFENGRLVPYDKPRGAEKRTKLVTEDGEPKSFEEAIEVLFNAHPESKSLLRTKRKSGAGSGSDTQTGGGSPIKAYGVAKIARGLQKKPA